MLLLRIKLDLGGYLNFVCLLESSKPTKLSFILLCVSFNLDCDFYSTMIKFCMLPFHPHKKKKENFFVQILKDYQIKYVFLRFTFEKLLFYYKIGNPSDKVVNHLISKLNLLI
jgi:hypothetical protein